MGENSQSIFFRLLGRYRSSREISRAYSIFKSKCGVSPALSEILFFKSCCAALIEDLGFIPPSYPDEAAAYLKLRYEGNIPAGWPTEKEAEAY
jgi:hypothetical protein